MTQFYVPWLPKPMTRMIPFGDGERKEYQLLRGVSYMLSGREIAQMLDLPPGAEVSVAWNPERQAMHLNVLYRSWPDEVVENHDLLCVREGEALPWRELEVKQVQPARHPDEQ